MKWLLMVVACGLAGCSNDTLECSVDDTLVFVAEGVSQWGQEDGLLYARTSDGKFVRRMQENETCRAVQAADSERVER